MKGELGLDHFEDRTFPGEHALMLPWQRRGHAGHRLPCTGLRRTGWFFPRGKRTQGAEKTACPWAPLLRPFAKVGLDSRGCQACGAPRTEKLRARREGHRTVQ